MSIRSVTSVRALYWHVGSKSRLLALTASRAFEEVVLPDEQALEWTDWLFEAGLRIRQVLHAHPNLAPMAGTQLVVTTTALPLVERMIGVLERAGFSGTRLVDAFNATFGFIIGWVAAELSVEPAESGDWKDAFAGELRSVNANLHPAIHRNHDALANNVFLARWDSGRARPMDSSYSFALRAIIAGLTAAAG
jgi:tetracycline repressor-like protein